METTVNPWLVVRTPCTVIFRIMDAQQLVCNLKSHTSVKGSDLVSTAASSRGGLGGKCKTMSCSTNMQLPNHHAEIIAYCGPPPSTELPCVIILPDSVCLSSIKYSFQKKSHLLYFCNGVLETKGRHDCLSWRNRDHAISKILLTTRLFLTIIL